MKKNDNFNEKELSMTRSYKYKEIQDEIDDLDIQKTKEIIINKGIKTKKKIEKKNIIVEDNDGFFEDIMSKKERKEYDISKGESLTQNDIKNLEKKATKKATKKDKDEITEEDLFITQSFKPLRKGSKLLNLLKPIFFLLVLSCVLFGLVYFYAYPKLIQYFVTPRYVFENAIDSVTVSLKDKLYSVDDGVNGFDLFIDINSNKYNVFNGYKYNFSYLFGKNENMVSFNYNENEKDLGMNIYFLNDKRYLNYSSNDYLYNVTSYEDINEYYDYYKNIGSKLDKLSSKEDTIYLIDRANEFLKSILKKEYLSKQNSVITIDNVKQDVTKHSLNIDGYYYKEIKKAFLSFVKNDSRLLEIVSDINGMSSSDYISYFESDVLLKNNDVKLVFDIYMINGNEFVGSDISIGGFRTFYYYKLDNSFEMYLNLTDYIDGTLKDKFKNIVILLKGTINEEKSNLLLNYNGKDKFEITMKKNDSGYVFNYALINSNRSGKISFKEDSNGFVLNRLSFDDEIDIKVNYISETINIGNYEILESDKKFKSFSSLFEKEFNKNNYIYTFDDFIKSVGK